MNLDLGSLKNLGGISDHLHGLKTYYERLSERERWIILGGGTGGALFLLILTLSLVAGWNAKIERDIEKSRQNIKTLRNLRSTYSSTAQEVERLDQLIQGSAGFQLTTELEAIGAKHGVSFDSVKTLPGPPNSYYQENQVALSIRKVNLRTLIDFLYDIENSRQILRVSTLNIKPNYQDNTQLNVSFVVSTFEALQ